MSGYLFGILRVGLWAVFLILAADGWLELSRSISPVKEAAKSESKSESKSIAYLSHVSERGRIAETPTPAVSPELRREHLFTRAAGTHESWPQHDQLSLARAPMIEVIAEDFENQHWVFRSPNFDFIADAPVSRETIGSFATLFELTHLYCRQLPFGLSRLHGLQEGGLQIYLIEDSARYVARGGRPNSNGVYLSDADVILLPFAGVGLPQDSARIRNGKRASHQTLVHEATHMLMRGPLLQEGWFVEGVAEYVATIPIQEQTFLLTEHEHALKSYLMSTGYQNQGGHRLGSTIHLTSLKELMEADYDTFQQIPQAYPFALLLFHYFVHHDGEGDGKRLRDYAQALQQGADTNTARKLLLAGRSYRTLEKLLTNSWANYGLTLYFVK